MSFRNIQNTCKTRADPVTYSNYFNTVHPIKAVHKCTETSLQPLLEFAAARLPGETKEKNIEGTHPSLRFMVLISPSQKTFWAWAEEARRRFRFINVLLQKAKCYKLQRLGEAFRHRENHSYVDHYDATVNKDPFAGYYTTLNVSRNACASGSLFLEIHWSVDIYSLFEFEPKHVLSRGVRKPLKRCFVTVLGDREKVKSAIRSKSGSCRTFRSIKRIVFQCQNGFLK